MLDKKLPFEKSYKLHKKILLKVTSYKRERQVTEFVEPVSASNGAGVGIFM